MANPMRPVMTATRVEFLDLAVGRCMQRLQRFPREFMVEFSYGCVWKCRVPPKPNGFADQTIPFLNGYFIGKINPTFSDKPIWAMVNTHG